jgi:hypothetical protein
MGMRLGRGHGVVHGIQLGRPRLRLRRGGALGGGSTFAVWALGFATVLFATVSAGAVSVWSRGQFMEWLILNFGMTAYHVLDPGNPHPYTRNPTGKVSLWRALQTALHMVHGGVRIPTRVLAW